MTTDGAAVPRARMKLTDELRGMLARAAKVPHPKHKQSLQIHPVQLRLWADDDGVAVRPWYVVVLELYPRGKVVNQYLARPVAQKPGPDQILRALLRHILEPPEGARARPAHVAVVERGVHAALQAVLPKAFTRLECTTLADGLDDYVNAFSERMVASDKGTRADGSQRAGLLRAGVGAREAGALATTACAMWRMGPWKRIVDTIALRAVVPVDDVRTQTYYVSVLGNDDDSVKGFALMPTLAALRAKYRRHNKAAVCDVDVGATNKPHVDLDKLLCAACGRCLATDSQRARRRPDDGERAQLYVYRCSGCGRVMYCNEKCQRVDWKARHRTECEKARTDENFVFERKEWAWLNRELALLFVDPTAVPFDDLDAFEQHAWPLIDNENPPLYPFAFVTVIQDQMLQPRVERPGPREVEVLTMIASALAECTAPPPEDTTLHLKNGVSISVCEDLKLSCARNKV